MPIEIIRLLAFSGPNMLGPRPGVLLQARAPRDLSARLRAALKEIGQRAGVVLATLDVSAEADGPACMLRASFATPTPDLGAEVARLAVAWLDAREQRDEAWDIDGRVWALQRLRRERALPVAALQLLAEAAARDVPAFAHADGALQLGYGARGTALRVARDTAGVLAPEDVGVASAAARAGQPPVVPWERLGAVPVVAVAGGPAAAQIGAQVAAGLRARGLRVASAAGASFDQARALLADQGAEAVVLGLDPGDALRRGLAFDRCAASCLPDLPADLPAEAAGRDELARALGVAMLVTDAAGVAVLSAETPELAALAGYAPARVELVRGTAEIERAAQLIVAHVTGEK